MLKAGPRRMQQVFVNLLNNAAYHKRRAHQGSPVLIDLRGFADSVVIRVSSDGRATAGSALQLLLEPRGEPAGPHESPYTGLGVGLFIVREILSRHGGSIAVEYAHEPGTTFTAEVPR